MPGPAHRLRRMPDVVEDVEVLALQGGSDRRERGGAQGHYLDRGAPAVGPQETGCARSRQRHRSLAGRQGRDREQDAQWRGTAGRRLAGLHLRAPDDRAPRVEGHELEAIRVAGATPRAVGRHRPRSAARPARRGPTLGPVRALLVAEPNLTGKSAAKSALPTSLSSPSRVLGRDALRCRSRLRGSRARVSRVGGHAGSRPCPRRGTPRVPPCSHGPTAVLSLTAFARMVPLHVDGVEGDAACMDPADHPPLALTLGGRTEVAVVTGMSRVPAGERVEMLDGPGIDELSSPRIWT